MIKKLFLWSVLLMTGFAFYSCDDVIDNPATGKQDPSNPNATWTYEVGIKFVDFNFMYADVDGEGVDAWKAPSTVYVYNKSREFLGELNALEEFDYENFDFNSFYKFSGTLKGAIGEELFITTLKDFDYYSKQDGTLKSIVENSVLEVGRVPIIVTNTSTGKIGTQNVKLENKINARRARFYNSRYYNPETDRAFTISSDSLMAENGSFTVNFAESVIPNNYFFFAFATTAQEEATYYIDINSENGYKSYTYFTGTYAGNTSVSGTYGYSFGNYVRELDLTKFFAFRKSLVEDADENWSTWANVETYKDNEAIVTQSGKDAIPLEIDIYGNVTLKDINVTRTIYAGNGYKGTSTITLEGENVVNSVWGSGFSTWGNITFKGNGSIAFSGYENGIQISDGYSSYIDEEGNEIRIINGITIDEGTTIKALAPKNEDGDYNSGVVVYGRAGDIDWFYVPEYDENGNWIGYHYEPVTLNLFDKDHNTTLTVNGTLEAEGGSQGIYSQFGIVKIGETGNVKAISRKALQKILFSTDDGEEAKLEDLVADKTKFNDTISEDNTTRIITKK